MKIRKKTKEYSKSRVIFFIFYATYFLFILTPSVIPIGNYVYHEIFLASYFSYYSECKFESIEQGIIELNNQGYNVNVTGTYNPSTNEIKIYREEKDKDYYTSLKHEFIHFSQHLNNRSFNCDSPLGVYLNEVESYTFSHLPDKIYIYFYGDYTD